MPKLSAADPAKPGADVTVRLVLVPGRVNAAARELVELLDRKSSDGSYAFDFLAALNQ